MSQRLPSSTSVVGAKGGGASVTGTGASPSFPAVAMRAETMHQTSPRGVDAKKRRHAAAERVLMQKQQRRRAAEVMASSAAEVTASSHSARRQHARVPAHYVPPEQRLERLDGRAHHARTRLRGVYQWFNRKFRKRDEDDDEDDEDDAVSRFPSSSPSSAASWEGGVGTGAKRAPRKVIASCLESNGSKRVLHEATHGRRRLRQHVSSSLDRNYGSFIRHMLSFNEWASSFLLPDGYPHTVTQSFTPYMQWRAVQYFFGGALGVFTTRSLMASLGVGQAGSKAAALNWVLKDGAGRLGRLLFARYGRQLDNDLKQFRFLGDLLMEAGAALELSTMFMPKAFLPLACIANVSKNVAVATAHSTRAPIYRAFSSDQVNHSNLGDITAKGESIGNLADIVGLGVGVLVSKFNPPLFPTFLLLSSAYIFSSVKECSCVQLPSFNHARLAVVLRQYFSDGRVMSPAEANSMEPLLFGCSGMASRSKAKKRYDANRAGATRLHDMLAGGDSGRGNANAVGTGAGDESSAASAAAPEESNTVGPRPRFRDTESNVPLHKYLWLSLFGHRSNDFSRHRVVVGKSVGVAFDSGAKLARAVRLYAGESFMISYRPDLRAVYVVLRDDVDHNNDAMLRATFQAHLLLHRLQMVQEQREETRRRNESLGAAGARSVGVGTGAGDAVMVDGTLPAKDMTAGDGMGAGGAARDGGLSDEEIGKCTQAAHALSVKFYPQFVKDAKSQGWDTDTLMLSAGRWRVHTFDAPPLAGSGEISATAAADNDDVTSGSGRRRRYT